MITIYRGTKGARDFLLAQRAPQLEKFRQRIARLEPYTWEDGESWSDDQAEDAITTLNRLIEDARSLKTDGV